VGSKKSTAKSKADVIVSTNPATGKPLGEVTASSPDEVRDAVARAVEVQAEWGRVPPKERGHRMLALRKCLTDRCEEIAERISNESGKTRFEAMSMEIVGLADLIGYYGKRVHKVLESKRIPLHLLKHRRSYVHYVPRGVVGIISPWNFPFMIPFGEAIMAMLAGNAVIIKPSEITPLIADLIPELVHQAGLPRDLVQIVHGRGDVGAALIDSGVHQICFTGSVATGRKVAVACGERLIPCTLELGGKAPAIVCSDADLERTAQALVWGAFANSGQVCASVERVYVDHVVHDALVGKVLRLTAKLRQGDPSSLDTDVGAICFDRQLNVAQELIEDATQAGATIECGGQAITDNGSQFFEPTVLTGVTQDMRCMREESFAPLMPIMPIRSEAEGIRLANDSTLGLLAYVFTKDREKGRRIANQIESGTVMVNDVLITYGAPETPWMGVKDSGIGRVHSDAGLRDFCQARHVNHDHFITLPRELWWYPYTEKAYNLTLRALRLFFGGRG